MIKISPTPGMSIVPGASNELQNDYVKVPGRLG